MTEKGRYICSTILKNKKIKTMKISKAALLALKGLDHEAKARIAEKAGVAPSTVYRWIADEHDNLTKGAVVKAISEEIGLSYEQVLEQETIATTK